MLGLHRRAAWIAHVCPCGKFPQMRKLPQRLCRVTAALRLQGTPSTVLARTQVLGADRHRRQPPSASQLPSPEGPTLQPDGNGRVESSACSAKESVPAVPSGSTDPSFPARATLARIGSSLPRVPNALRGWLCGGSPSFSSARANTGELALDSAEPSSGAVPTKPAAVGRLTWRTVVRRSSSVKGST